MIACSFLLSCIDFVRGSVVFNDINDFVEGVRKFKTKFYQIECIQDIVRTKNDFNKFQDLNLSDLDLNSFDYCDIKFNVLLAFNGVRVCIFQFLYVILEPFLFIYCCLCWILIYCYIHRL